MTQLLNQGQLIENVIGSKTFAGKEVLKGLLKYLYEEAQKGNTLKEASIAAGFFKRGNDFIPGEDTIVRVNIYKLRSLLEKYYAEEGVNDPYIIEIPKGSYLLSYRSKIQQTAAVIKQKKLSRSSLVLIIISLTVNAVFVVLFLKSHTEKRAINPVWSSYLNSSQPVFITLGDPFFFRVNSKKSESGSLIVRDIFINSKEDLQTRKPVGLQKDSSAISELNYPYFSRNNLWPLPDLIAVFAKSSIETRLQTLSESNIDDIKNNNVVFIGNINSFGWMAKFLKKTSISIETNPRKIKLNRQNDTLDLSVPEHVKGNYTDYAFLVKLPGPNNNFISMMGDFHASGLRGLSGFISKRKSLKELEDKAIKQYGHFPQYFEMLVKVTSYDYSDFETELVHFKSLE